MATIVTRETGATAVNRTLTNAELDNNFINLNADLESKQPLDADLTAIATLTGTSGLLKKTAANTWVLDTTAYLSSISSSDVTTALGFTPYNATNPNGYITSSALSDYLTSATAASTYQTQSGMSSYLTTANALNTYQLVDADLTAIAALSGTSGILKKTAANTWVLDTTAYLSNITSSEVTTALGFTPENSANKGQVNGYASLDSSGLVPSTQLPSYVDDVLEYGSLAALPATGSSGKIYVTQDTSKIYRWSGSAYIEITGSPGSTDSVTEGSANLYFTEARARSSISVTQNLTYNPTTGVITGPDLTSFLASTTAASTYQPLDGDLTAIAALSSTSGILKKTGTNTWVLDTNSYLTSITSNDVTTALGYTPYNATNPSGYLTSSSSLDSANLTGTIAPARLGSGTADSTTFLRGDGTWAIPAGGGGGGITTGKAIAMAMIFGG